MNSGSGRMPKMANVMETDVLVVGGGGAAARAALEATLAGAKVVLVTKGNFGAVGTRGAGATNSALSPFGIIATPGWTGPLAGGEKILAHMVAAPPEEAYRNIIQVGLGMADPKLARILVEDAVETRTSLLKWGALFGEYGLKSHGAPIMEALVRQIRSASTTVLERTMVVDLLVRDGECVGAAAVGEMTSETVIIRAGATVIATGGDADLYMINLNPPCVTGDGYAMGYEAGAELMNLEFKQIFLGTLYPTKNMITNGLPPHVKLTNGQGEEFLSRYLPKGTSAEECLAQRQLHNPFSTRDPLSRYVDIAIIGEVKAGRATPHLGIYLDRTDPRIPPLPLQRNEFWRYRGIDFDREAIEVGICHHSSLGGFRINENGETTVRGLYAAGEAAAGPHGVDRIGGHMLLASQVFGARAGRHAAKERKLKQRAETDKKLLYASEERISNVRNRKGNVKPLALKRKLQESAYFNLLVAKSEATLARFQSDVRTLKEEATSRLCISNPGELVEALELENLLVLADVQAAVCLARKESRGSHYREDFPSQDDAHCVRSIVAKKRASKLELDTIVLDPAWQNRGDEKFKHWA
jgi:fumarate reductase (CoM/CoB) subunit A